MSILTTGKPVRLMAAITAVLMPLTACTSAKPSPSSSGTPAGLERFHRQTLQWEKCDGYAKTATESTVMGMVDGLECTRMQAPLSYDDPGGRTVQIAVARRSAPGDALGSLVLNPGGPGGSGLFATATTALGLDKAKSPLTGRFDLVGFDPRGVGATVPAVDCFSDAEADRGTVTLSAQGTTVQWTEQDTKAVVDRCVRGSGGPENLAHLGTRDVARDLDILRTVLGDEKLTFLGQSYGTRLGAVYAEQFPSRVRAMLLDGGIDPTQGTLERRVGAYAGFQAAFERMAAFCAKQAGCPLGRDPKTATTQFQKIMQPLYATPVPALGGELTFDAAIGGVISGLYAEAAWPRIIKGITQIGQGRGDELAQLGYDFSGRDAKGAWPNFAEANYAINCMDEERLTEQQGGELRAATYRQAPFMDPGADVLSGARDSCEHWPARPTLGYPYADDVTGLPGTLVVSITGDPTTPHAGGIRLAETLGSTLLTVRGEGHTVVMAGTNPCVDRIAAAYLIDLELPEEGTTCDS
ncbi:alpha/beta hydrolase [Actinoplanes italicus]|uniref:Alpha/beta hydrolase family protein n=1 Tax=Actinoplanes italicus TaxID=113567 RepID=A0A2T0KI77_9ACTN|nr:alpha/beta hydrolase [Actinoplanes italicus]PRX22947.1 alpha/beta hydrolase family protein [Actinoplanes italicus]GIE28469.1 alpha/beta hydrolase [Actinoplanes italicus]